MGPRLADLFFIRRLLMSPEASARADVSEDSEFIVLWSDTPSLTLFEVAQFGFVVRNWYCRKNESCPMTGSLESHQ